MATPVLIADEAAIVDITIAQGITFVLIYEWHEGTETGPLVDLSGYTARGSIRLHHGTPEILSLTSRLSISAGTGEITLRIAAADTAALNFDEAIYDIELVAGSGDVYRLAKGTVHLSREVTL